MKFKICKNCKHQSVYSMFDQYLTAAIVLPIIGFLTLPLGGLGFLFFFMELLMIPTLILIKIVPAWNKKRICKNCKIVTFVK